jgi:formylglycine-generating enzyme required for sulfatase activity/biopolymer transport protein ExbD
MSTKCRCALLAIAFVLISVPGAYAQLRPDVTPPPVNAPTPKPPTPKPTQIVIETSPSAQVYLDGVRQGEASKLGHLVIANPQPGDHTLRVSLAGKKNYEQKVKVIAGQEIKIKVVLADLSGTVVVQSSPGASVFLDGAGRGTTDANGQLSVTAVAVGAHQLRISASGKKDFQQQITVISGQEASIQAPLSDLPGTVVVRTSQGATVFLDDSNRGTTDPQGQLSIPEVVAGSHELRISADGKKDFQQRIIVSAGQEARIEAQLKEAASPPPSTPSTLRVNPKDGLKYQWVPAGTFIMGCSPGDNECNESENPPHEVTISNGFWLGQTEVTVGAYKRFVAATGRLMPPPPDFNKGWADDNMPIVFVHWREAQAYCKWAGGRLPTEAEWEYAARGGNKAGRYGKLDEIAWDVDNCGRASGGGTHDVGQKQANGYGLYDMLGNALEWVNDWYDPVYYKHTPSQDPLGPMNGKERVLRGGSWLNDPRDVRVSNRFKYDPAYRNSNFGFRCAGIAFGP